MGSSKKIIFDMDGTLYPFEPGASFGASLFYTALQQRILAFIGAEFGLGRNAANQLLNAIDKQFDGELGIGFEKLYGIDRYRYYAATWTGKPADFMAPDSTLIETMAALKGDALLLTAAPRIWATQVLDYLGLAEIFGDNLITGEPDIRKPDIRVFLQAAQKLGVEPQHIISVGDQNHSDIVPAKSVGMTTVLIGSELLDADYHAGTIHDALTLIKEKLL